jgi:hypothetical protein
MGVAGVGPPKRAVLFLTANCTELLRSSPILEAEARLEGLVIRAVGTLGGPEKSGVGAGALDTAAR